MNNTKKTDTQQRPHRCLQAGWKPLREISVAARIVPYGIPVLKIISSHFLHAVQLKPYDQTLLQMLVDTTALVDVHLGGALADAPRVFSSCWPLLKSSNIESKYQ